MNEITQYQEPQSAVAITPMTMLSMAVSQNADLDKLERLMELQSRWELNEARKAFNTAMGEFKSEGVTVGKDATVKYGTTSYVHATLGNVCGVVGAALAKHGLSHRWNIQQGDGRIKVTCILSHTLGHSESVTLEAGSDTSGSKNSIQAIASTVTYLERYTLLAATGTATAEQDDDGRGFGVESTGEIKEKIIQPQAKSKPPAQANQPSNNALAEAGEVAYLKNKIAALKETKIEDLLAESGLTTLDNLSKDGFVALRDALKGKK